MKIEEFLAPWEYHAAFEPHEQFWDGEAHVTLVQAPLLWRGAICAGRAALIEREDDFFLGFEPIPGDGWWFESTRRPFARPSRFSSPVFRPRSTQEWAARWQKIVERGEICRAFGVRDPHTRQHVGVGVSPREGCVFRFEGSVFSNSETHFRLADGEETDSSAKIWARLQNDWQNPTSTLGVALFFRVATDLERMKMLCELPFAEFKARYAQLESLLGWVLQLDPDFWLPTEFFALQLYTDVSKPRAFRRQTTACTALESNWIDRICHAFDFPPDFEAIEKHLALGEFARQSGIRWQIQRRPFSMHEKLEAQLHLMEWARENLPPREAENWQNFLA